MSYKAASYNDSRMVSQIFIALETDSGHPLPESYLMFLLAVPGSKALWGFSAILLLLFISASLAAAKVAFFSLTINDIQKISAENTPTSRHILALRQQPRRLRATLFISTNLMIIGVISLINYFIFHLLQSWESPLMLVSYPPRPHNGVVWANALGFSMTTTVVAFLMMIFAEVSPKAYVERNRVLLAKWMAAPLMVLMQILQPVSAMLMSTNKFLERRFLRNRKQNTTSKDAVEEAIDLAMSGNGGDKEPSEQEVDMLKSIVKFSDVTVRQIMTSRMDVVAVDEQISYPELLAIVTESGYSRIPVYEGDFDNIRGILYVKDLLRHLNTQEAFQWQSLVRHAVLYVPESKKISDVLREFQKQRLHMAIVVDEYGGSSGIVTLEDVLEEIIGDIKDEFDDEAELQYRQLDDHTYVFEGKTLLPDVYRVTGIEAGTFDEIRGEADSLAGLMLAIHGQLPKKDTELVYENFRFKIIAVNKRRIEQVHISNTNP